MGPRYLLDTHIVIRWLFEPRKLSRDQTRVLAGVEENREPVAVSAITLLEVVSGVESGRVRARVEDVFDKLNESSWFQILPFTIEIATESLPQAADFGSEDHRLPAGGRRTLEE